MKFLCKRGLSFMYVYGWNSSGHDFKPKKKRNWHSFRAYYVSNSSDLRRLSHLLLTTFQRMKVLLSRFRNDERNPCSKNLNEKQNKTKLKWPAQSSTAPNESVTRDQNPPMFCIIPLTYRWTKWFHTPTLKFTFRQP